MGTQMSKPDEPSPVRLVDRAIPGPGSRLDTVAQALQRSIAKIGDVNAGHPIAAAVPIGAWVTGAVFDVRSRPGGRPADEHAADVALWIGILAAVPTAITGWAQFLDTTGAARRETVVHAALNNAALLLNLLSAAARTSGRRRAGRRLSGVALTVVGASGFLGGDLAYRHGVGVRRKAS
jgi:uncharacterized membrane protein